MKKDISMILKLLKHRLCFGFRVEPDTHNSLKKRNEKIVRDYKQGCSIKHLAQEYHLGEGRISQILIAYNARQPKWRKMSQEQRRVIFRLYKKDLSMSKIGRQVGCSRQRVHQILQQGA